MTEINNYEISTTELKKHFTNLINALIAICPTRNYITQFLMYLPEEYSLMYDSFPEFLTDKLFRGQFQYALGLTIGPEINYLPNSFAQNLIKLIQLTFDLFNSEEWPTRWNELLGEIRSEKISNPLQEWIMAKTNLAIQDPIHGKYNFKILKILHENQPPNYNSDEEGGLQTNKQLEKGIKMEDLLSILQISKFELDPTIHFLMDKLKLIKMISQKNEDNTEGAVLLLEDSVKKEWLDDLFKRQTD